MHTFLHILKSFFTTQFFKSLFWSLAYKGAEKAIEKLISEGEQKGWIGNIPEKEAAKILGDFLRGESIPPNKRAKLIKMITAAVYHEEYKE